MDEPNWPDCTEEQFWEFIAWHLAGSGIQTILVGGAVVSVYAGDLYRSGDIDLVLENSRDRTRIAEILLALGFIQANRHFKHPQCPHIYVEFPPGPVAIGEDYHIQPAQRYVEGRVLQLLSPTDCVKNRLTQYIHWQQRDTFDQAVLVATTHEIDWEHLRQWCQHEGREPVAQELFLAVARRRAGPPA